MVYCGNRHQNRCLAFLLGEKTSAEICNQQAKYCGFIVMRRGFVEIKENEETNSKMKNCFAYFARRCFNYDQTKRRASMCIDKN